MSASFQCPRCGMSTEGTLDEILELTAEHPCLRSRDEAILSGVSWPGMIVAIAFFVLVSFVCTDGWGRFS